MHGVYTLLTIAKKATIIQWMLWVAKTKIEKCSCFKVVKKSHELIFVFDYVIAQQILRMWRDKIRVTNED